MAVQVAKEEELLSGNDAYYCPQCKTHRDSAKSMSVFRAPRVLVLHIKRFQHSAFSRDKLITPLQFPSHGLNIAPYCHKSRIAEEEQHKCALTYNLIGVSNHMGSLGGGHYTADCASSRDKWHNFNDARVSETAVSKLGGASPYLLFYEQT